MSDKELRISVLLSTYSGMLGNISTGLRILTIDWNVTRYHIRAVYDRPTTDDDEDDIGAIAGEVLANITTMIDCKEEAEYSKAPLMDLPRLGTTVFLRSGEL